MTTIDNYARFWKCALQVNPFGYEQNYRGKASAFASAEDYNKALLQAALDEGINVIGVADHGTVEHVDPIRTLFAQHNIVVFPGFEIASTEKIHMVCLYPEETDRDTLNRYLGALGLTNIREKVMPSKLSCLDIAREVEKQGGFWFAAHVTGRSGLLKLQKDGGGLAHVWRDDLVVAAQIGGAIEDLDEGVKEILANQNNAYKRKRQAAIINARDVATPDDLRNPESSCLIKMTSPSFEGFRLAFMDAKSRILLNSEQKEAYGSRIEEIVIDNGYLDSIAIRPSPQLNAIIGGRGTGKSTLIESLRYVLGHSPRSAEAKATHLNITKENLGSEGAKVTIKVRSYAHHGKLFTISRRYGEPIEVKDELGNVSPLRPEDVVPNIEVFGQNEILQIAQSDVSQATLIQRFVPSQIDVVASISTLTDQAQRNRRELAEVLDSIADLETKVAALPSLLEQEKAFNLLGIDNELANIGAVEAERGIVQQIDDRLEEAAEAVSQFDQSLTEVAELDFPDTQKLTHDAELKSLTTGFNNLLATLKRFASQASTALTNDASRHEAEKTAWSAKVAQVEVDFENKFSKLPNAAGKTGPQIAAEYRRLVQQINRTKPLEEKLGKERARQDKLQKVRRNVLSQLRVARDERLKVLTATVKKLNKTVAGKLKVELRPGGIREPLREFLMSAGLEGVGVKRLGWIDQVDSLTIADFVEALGNGKEGLLERYKAHGMAAATAESIAAMSGSRRLELEEIDLPDRIELLLNVGMTAENYRPLNRLSTGQQCTAILHLLLLENRDPLIMDQPEDNLDNAFIADRIVSEVRAGKIERQFLFATHNANIPVFGDAEWIGVLEEEDGRAKLAASGSIDMPDVRDYVANILEGGREAFMKRLEMYQF